MLRQREYWGEEVSIRWVISIFYLPNEGFQNVKHVLILPFINSHHHHFSPSYQLAQHQPLPIQLQDKRDQNISIS